MKKIKLLTSLTVLATIGTTVGIVSSCNSKTESSDLDHMVEPSESEKQPTIEAGETEHKYSFTFKETVTKETLTPSVINQKQSNVQLVKIKSYSMNDKKCDLVIEWVGSTEEKTTCTFDFQFKSTNGWTNTVKGCKFTFTPEEPTAKTATVSYVGFDDITFEEKTTSLTEGTTDTITIKGKTTSSEISGTIKVTCQAETDPIFAQEDVTFNSTDTTTVTFTLTSEIWEKVADQEELVVTFDKDEDNFEIDTDTGLVTLTDAALTLSGKIKVPSTVDGIIVKGIDVSGFANAACSQVVFADNSNFVTISEKAFEGTTSLTAITIPASVSTIGSSAFKDSGIQTATFGNATNWVLNVNNCTDVTVGTDAQGIIDNATALKDCSATGKWGYDGIKRYNSMKAWVDFYADVEGVSLKIVSKAITDLASDITFTYTNSKATTVTAPLYIADTNWTNIQNISDAYEFLSGTNTVTVTFTEWSQISSGDKIQVITYQ